MALSATSRARFNLSGAQILLLDETSMGMQVLVQILVGFGAKSLTKADSLPEARDYLDLNTFDLMIVDTLQGGKGYDFVHWLRRSGLQPNCHAPVLMTAPHTRVGDVARARDCGAHFILAKPLTPMAMLERILWIGREGRQFVECDSYVGPDRRFHDEPQHPGRRRTDRAQSPTPPAADQPVEGANLQVNP